MNKLGLDNAHSMKIIAVISLMTILIRCIPYILFGRKGRKTPEYILWLGKVLPYAIMGMLTVYCFKDVSVLSYPYGLPELIAGGVVVGLHLWKRNTLISIGAGIASYMLLVQLVF